MHGTIIEFNRLHGCGVIQCEHPKIQVYLSIHHAKDEKYLQIGDVVTFVGCSGPSGPEAREVILLWRSEILDTTLTTHPLKTSMPTWQGSRQVMDPEDLRIRSQPAKPQIYSSLMETSTNQPNDREACANCGKLMTPTLALANGTPQRSFCPFCGGVHKDFTKPSVPTLKDRTADAAATGIIGLIIGSLF